MPIAQIDLHETRCYETLLEDVMQTGPQIRNLLGLGRVLIVDDEANIRKIIRMALTKTGYDVVEASDGEKAIEVLGADDNPLVVDLILCDLRMPHFNGMETIAYFRSRYPSVPVIVLTGYPDDRVAATLLQQGVADYLVKPVPKVELLASVAAAMESRMDPIRTFG
jgi:two-component system chemotaxis response regulator CheY